MQQEYSTNEFLRTSCRQIMALALMPRDQVINGFNEIRAADQLTGGLLEHLLMYFEKTWLDEIDLWNVYKCDTRNNNVCEGENGRQSF